MKTIAVFTGNRAEYGLLSPVLTAIRDSVKLRYQLIVSGAHLDDDFGKTLQLIQKDGFSIFAEAKIESTHDSHTSTALAIASCIQSVVDVLNRGKPDMLVVYADRFEGFAAVIAASQMGIPVVHVEGGDNTEGGAFDDSVRHAMTKLSHIHFVTNEEAERRVIAMGEERWRVLNIGLPSLDKIVGASFATPFEIEQRFKIDTKKPIVLFTQHSVALEFQQARKQIKESLSAIEAVLLEHPDVQVVLTYPNNDVGGRFIIEELQGFAFKQNTSSVQLHHTLGMYYYHGILALSRNRELRVVCAGNSSSGIKETPVFGCPTLNIGSRQAGRLRASNVVDSDYCSQEIFTRLVSLLFDDELRQRCFNSVNPYGDGKAAFRACRFLENIVCDEILLKKKMTIE